MFRAAFLSVFAMTAVVANGVGATAIPEEFLDELFPEPSVQTVSHGLPVRRFGSTWICAEAPTLWDDKTFQVGNVAPREKVPVKRSSELRSNFFGVNTTRMPARANHYRLFSQAVHLIDGDLSTHWESLSQPRAEMQPVQIRLDLVAERTVCAVELTKLLWRPEYRRRSNDPRPSKHGVETGRGLPVELTVEVSRDACTWEKVFEGPTGDVPTNESFRVDFAARPVKQVRLTATKMRLVGRSLYSVSLAEVSVLGADGTNWARADLGGTVAVSSTAYQAIPYPAQQRELWPVHWDLGLKWVRVGYHDDPINWHRVEREKGRLEVDPVCDAAVTALKRNGVNVILCLNFGNRLYCGPDFPPLPFAPEWNACMPQPPKTPEALTAWERYVVFMCEKFRDRVHTFEIWNEWDSHEYWGDWPKAEDFARLLERTIPLVRKHAPGAKVMLGSAASYFRGFAAKSPDAREKLVSEDMRFVIWKRFAKDVDVVGFHPFYNPKNGVERTYTEDLRAFQAWLRSVGFRGTASASEWCVNGRYPLVERKDKPDVWCDTHGLSELMKAKAVARQMVRPAAFGMTSIFCEGYNAFYPATELSLLKASIHQDPIAPIQPSASYYVLRNLSTMMDGLEPADFTVKLEGIGKPIVEAFPFADGNRRAVAVWYEDPDRVSDDYAQIPARLELPFAVKGDLWAYDPVNGVRQRLTAKVADGRTVVEGLLVGNGPLIVKEAE